MEEKQETKTTPTWRKCPHCGKKTRAPGPYCQWDRYPMDPNDPIYTTNEEEISMEQKKPNHSFFANTLIGILVFGLLFLILYAFVVKPAIDSNATKSERTLEVLQEQARQIVALQNQNAEPQTVITYVTAAPAVVPPTSDTMALNEKTELEPLDMPLWNDYYKSGVQVTESSDTVWYAQSGKDGTNRLWGSITKNQILVIDSYKLVKDGVTYDGGNLLMLRGPVNFNNYEIYYTDGAVQLIDPDHAQELLDYNIAVKFARGDWDQNKGQFSYKPWALANVWTLDYIYHPLRLSVKTDNYTK